MEYQLVRSHDEEPSFVAMNSTDETKELEVPRSLEPARSLSSLAPMPLVRGLSGLNGNGDEPPKIGRLFPSSSPQLSPQQPQAAYPGFPGFPQSSPTLSPLSVGPSFSFTGASLSSLGNGLYGAKEAKDEGLPRLLPITLPVLLTPEHSAHLQQIGETLPASISGTVAEVSAGIGSYSPASVTDELVTRLRDSRVDDTQLSSPLQQPQPQPSLSLLGAVGSSSSVAAPSPMGTSRKGGLRKKRPRPPEESSAVPPSQQQQQQQQQQAVAAEFEPSRVFSLDQPSPPLSKKRRVPQAQQQGSTAPTAAAVAGGSRAGGRSKSRTVSEAVDRSQEVDPKPFWNAPFRGDRLAIMGNPSVGFFFVVTDLCRLLTNSVESRKNVSNRISDFKSPQEKVKLTVVRKNKAGKARAQKGTNCLTIEGLKRFLDEAAGTQATARGLPAVRSWLEKKVLPKLQAIQARGGPGPYHLDSESDSESE